MNQDISYDDVRVERLYSGFWICVVARWPERNEGNVIERRCEIYKTEM
jgi:hypothetical protein